MKYFIITALFILSAIISDAQVYWQQKVDTKIDVTLDDKKHILRGYEEFIYLNNSPDTLHYIYIHLWPNAYKHDHTPFAEQQYRNRKTDFYYAKPFERGYIDSLQFTVNGNDVDYFFGENTPDIARINLPQPLPPGQQLKITTPFKVKIPKVFSRLGHTGQSYFISQWFPKPAVYDKKGWHPISYLDQGEFYSEIGSYDVSITLPENYIVMGTGNLLDEKENNWLDSLSKLPIKKDTTKKIVKKNPAHSSAIKTSTPITQPTIATKTIHFHEDNIHDFAWFADKRWIVRKDTVTSPGSGNLVTTYAAFLPAYQKQWSKANEHLKNAVKYYGKWVGPYPYKTIKAVQGDMKAGGGMEYPTVTIIDINAGDQTTIIHEAGHNWFYGILATNERDHAWMDEGINTFYETKTTNTLNEKDSLKRNKKVKSGNISVTVDLNTILYQLQASGDDQAIEQTSNNFRELNYGADVYYKTSAMLQWLENYMGDKNFEAAMHEYYDTWKHKHPYPQDFQAIMQKHTNKPIGWLFMEALQTKDMVDFSIKNVATKNDGVNVTIKNKTRMSLPVAINAYHKDSLLATGFALPFAGTTTIELPKETNTWTKIKIAKEIPDGRTTNNEYRKNGLLHRGGVLLRPFAGTAIGNRQKTFIAPAIGYNFYDGFMGGLLFHNLTWPETKFKYAIAPLYGFGSKSFVGAAAMSYTWHPTKTFKEIFLQADIKSFNYDKLKQGFNEDSSVFIPGRMYARYLKIAPSLNFILKQSSELSTIRRTLTLKAYAITEEDFDFQKNAPDSFYKPSPVQQQRYYGLLRYSHQNNRTFNPFNYSVEAQLGEDFAKINVEGNIKINYHTKGKSLYVRAYAGKYFIIHDNPSSERYFLNSTSSGLTDYLYDETYIGRNETEGFSARQISIKEGGLKIPTFRYLSTYGIGRSDNWMASINLKTDLPLRKLPIRLFLDIATFAEAGKLNPSGNKVLYDGGVEIHFLDVVNIYVPLVMSQDYNDYRTSITGKKSLLDGITFTLQLHKINWLKAPSGIFKVIGY